MAENAVEVIGGSFALGQWLADHHTAFQKQWDTWRLAIQSAGGVAGEDSVVLDVSQSTIAEADRALVFKYNGPAEVSPLIVSTTGDRLLEQVYVLVLANAPSFFPLIISLPQQVEKAGDRPPLPSTPSNITLPKVALPVTLLSTLTISPSLPSVAESNVVAPPGVVLPTIVQTVFFEPASSVTKVELPSGPPAEIIALPEATETAIAVAELPALETAANPVPLSVTETEIVTLPNAAELPADVALPSDPASPTPTMESVDQDENVALSEATQPEAAVLLPESADQAENVLLPEATQPEIAGSALPESETLDSPLIPPSSEPPVVEIPELPPATDLPQPKTDPEFALTGQYLLPVGGFPTGVSEGSTLRDVIQKLAGAELPPAVAGFLGHVRVRKGFLVFRDQFKGLVLEFELDQPMRSLVRLALAKATEKWTFGGEFFVARFAKDGTPRPPLIFIIRIATDKDSKSLMMAYEGEVNLVDELLRPMFGSQLPIPESFSLTVENPALVLVKEKSTTKALLAVSLRMDVDFGDLPFVGEVIKTQGPATINLGVQYASAPFAAAAIAEVNSVLNSNLQLATDEGAEFNGLHVAAALQMAGKPFLFSVPVGADTDDKKETADTTSPTTNAGDQMIKWIKVNRTLGPAYLDKVGVGFSNGAVQFRVSASVQMSGLTFFVEGLGGGLKLAWPPKTPSFNLDGLGISLNSPPIAISGALIRSIVNGVESFDGMAMIKASNFTIAGLGSYSKIGGDHSLFIFAVLHADLGGPSFFYVTGLAAGFGFNRALRLPPIDEVQNFPLVRGALDEKYFSGSGARQMSGALEKLRNYIPPSGGEYWFAVGIRFNSFEMIQSFAMISVSFGHEVQIGLLGMSRMSLPKGAEPGNAIAYAELALRAVIKPDEGSIAVEGRLTDNSYVFSHNCRLTGGFAFYIWFAGTHSGDFVITLGGYHPRFNRPEHYPIVPRLGVNWQVSSQLRVTAEMYFALTPSCLMAGGKMSVVYNAGAIKAWFCAYADFLLSWQPFYYTIDMGISIGVEADLGLFSIRVHLSVGLHIWGPEFAGQIDVDLSVISFTIRFGPDKAPPGPLTAKEFVTAFLPPAPPPKPLPRAQQRKAAPAPLTASEAITSATPEVIATQINSGLIRQETGDDNQPLRIVNGHALALSVQSMIPVTKFSGLAPSDGNASIKSLDLLGARAMGKTTLRSEFSVGIRNILDPNKNPGERPNLRVTTIENGVPEAVWGKSKTEGVVPAATPEAKTIPVTIGIRIAFAPIHPQGALPAMDIEKFAYETFNKPIPWDANLKPAPPLSAGEQSQGLDTVMSDATIQLRNAVLDVLTRQSPFVLNKVDLSQLVKHRESYFQADPTIARLGSLNESIV